MRADGEWLAGAGLRARSAREVLRYGSGSNRVEEAFRNAKRNKREVFFMFAFEEECGLTLVKDLVNDTNLSRIYGFILFTERNPYVSKVLADKDFWIALDKISGSNWPIFAVRPLSEMELMMSKISKSNSQKRSISYMTDISSNIKAYTPIIKDFALDETTDFPCFVVFMWNDKDELLQMGVNIEGNNTDAVYHSIEEIVKAVTKVEHDIEPQYKRSENVFRNVIVELDAL